MAPNIVGTEKHENYYEVYWSFIMHRRHSITNLNKNFVNERILTFGGTK